jgi:hypothetical protein
MGSTVSHPIRRRRRNGAAERCGSGAPPANRGRHRTSSARVGMRHPTRGLLRRRLHAQSPRRRRARSRAPGDGVAPDSPDSHQLRCSLSPHAGWPENRARFRTPQKSADTELQSDPSSILVGSSVSMGSTVSHPIRRRRCNGAAERSDSGTPPSNRGRHRTSLARVGMRHPTRGLLRRRLLARSPRRKRARAKSRPGGRSRSRFSGQPSASLQSQPPRRLAGESARFRTPQESADTEPQSDPSSILVSSLTSKAQPQDSTRWERVPRWLRARAR